MGFITFFMKRVRDAKILFFRFHLDLGESEKVL